jgi:hypothetical protein
MIPSIIRLAQPRRQNRALKEKVLSVTGHFTGPPLKKR